MIPTAYQWIAYCTVAAFPCSETTVADTKLDANTAATIANAATMQRLIYGNLPGTRGAAAGLGAYAGTCACGMRVTIGMEAESSAV